MQKRAFDRRGTTFVTCVAMFLAEVFFIWPGCRREETRSSCISKPLSKP